MFYMGSIKVKNILEGIKLPKRGNVNNMVLFYNALNKSNDWRYEKEWRYVFPYKNIENKNIYLPVPKPKAIYLGAMIEKDNSEKIIEIGKERNIDVYKMNRKVSEFALKSEIIHKSDK